MATRDYRTNKAQAPPPLPAWMTDLSAQDQQALHPQWQPPGGYAEMDQYQSGGIPSTGSLGDRILNQGDYWSGNTANLPIGDTNKWSQGGAVGLAPSVAGNVESLGDVIANNYQNVNSLDGDGYALQSRDPNKMDRFGRALNGVFKGYDTGNTAGNVGLQVGASLVPGGGLINAGAGAIQGATSDAKVFDRVLPESGNAGRGTQTSQTDVMPRGIFTGQTYGLLDPATGGGAEYTNGAGAFGGGATSTPPAVSNPLQPGVRGAGSAQFTGGSGAAVDPYQLAPQDSLEALLANAQRYTDYDASTGRTGRAGAATGAGGYSYSGFDFAQDAGNRDIGKSAKYAFSQFAEDAARSGAPMPRTKADAESWFNQHVAPKMAQAGYEVLWVKGDKAQIRTREGVDIIDFVGGADGDNPTLTWQSEVLAPGPGMQGGGVGQGGGSLPVSGTDDLYSSDLFARLMEQAQAIARGQSNGSDFLTTDALTQLLGNR